MKILVPLLIRAQRRNSSWLQDFADDLVIVDADLHDVLLAYEKLQQDTCRMGDDDEHRSAA